MTLKEFFMDFLYLRTINFRLFENFLLTFIWKKMRFYLIANNFARISNIFARWHLLARRANMLARRTNSEARKKYWLSEQKFPWKIPKVLYCPKVAKKHKNSFQCSFTTHFYQYVRGGKPLNFFQYLLNPG